MLYVQEKKQATVHPPPPLSYPRLDTIDLPCPKPLSSHAKLSGVFIGPEVFFFLFFLLFFGLNFWSCVRVHGLVHVD